MMSIAYGEQFASTGVCRYHNTLADSGEATRPRMRIVDINFCEKIIIVMTRPQSSQYEKYGAIKEARPAWQTLIR